MPFLPPFLLLPSFRLLALAEEGNDLGTRAPCPSVYPFLPLVLLVLVGEGVQVGVSQGLEGGKEGGREGGREGE